MSADMSAEPERSNGDAEVQGEQDGMATGEDTSKQAYPVIVGKRPQFGEGRESLLDGGYYEGPFRYGKRDGEGVLVCNAEGTEVYKGQFELEFMHGVGCKTWPDSSVYTGQWQQGRKHGQGIYEEASGRRYEGQWLDGRRHGVGTQQLDKNSHYEGRWENGLQHGTGKYTDKDGSVYEGKWHSGSHHGPGLLRYKDGTREKRNYCYGMLQSKEDMPKPVEYLPLKRST